jgi:hypothetical protein
MWNIWEKSAQGRTGSGISGRVEAETRRRFMSDGREEREEREKRREQEERENREDRIDRYRADEWEPERVDS